MTAMRTIGKLAALLVGSLLSACGSDLHVRLFVSINAPPQLHTHGAFIALNGTAALPAGSVRDAGGGCRAGAFTIVWSNTTGGTRGHAFANWHCPAEALDWRSGDIPLVPGTNSIRIALNDEQGSAESTVVVTRD
ncbi:MAG TPA: hypothetical protein PK177_16890 [Burkholderiaceae bacterium]|nr:hypothetical protein [Burkholderiaceae bacterium]